MLLRSHLSRRFPLLAVLLLTMVLGGIVRGDLLYVAEYASNRVVAVTDNYSPVSIFASGLNHPMGIAVDAAGSVYVSDLSNRILKYTAPETYTVFATGLNLPGTLALDISGNLFVCEVGTGRLLRFTAPETSTIFASGLDNPQGLAIDSANQVYLSEASLGKILKFTAPNTSTQFASNLSAPHGLALDATGMLYVTNYGSGSTVTYSAPDTPVVYAAGYQGPQAVALDSAGHVFIAEYGSLVGGAGLIREFTERNGTGWIYSGYFDNPTAIAFAPAPEPGSAVLFALGAALCGVRRRHS